VFSNGPVNHAPKLNSSLNPALPTIAEDATNHSGTLVSSLLNGASDVEGDAAIGGMAVVSAQGSGTWQFSFDGGGTWQVLGAAKETAARLLPAHVGSRVRFVPNANFNGTVKLWYRAWDQTQGIAGGTFNLTNQLGGSTAFSTDRENALLTVTAVNDSPMLTLSGSIGYDRNAAAIFVAPSATVKDVDSPNFAGGRLRVTISSGASASNRLSVGGAFSVDASNNVLLGGTIIGKRTSSGFGTKELIIVLNTNAAKSIAQQLTRAITFKTVGGSAGTRSVRFTISDGDGGTSLIATKIVNVR
jgi:hypothetical protein